MRNTQFSVSESSSLVTSLIARSEEGKLKWEEDLHVFSEMQNDQEGFRAELEGGLRVIISSDRVGVLFEVYGQDQGQTLLTAGPEQTLLSVYLEHDPKFGYDLPGERELHPDLVRLHELARRSAFKVDEKLANAREYLRRLAG
ncbi:MAG: hypothetical protein ACLGSH_15820 [Acidobacteriota bacterium]